MSLEHGDSHVARGLGQQKLERVKGVGPAPTKAIDMVVCTRAFAAPATVSAWELVTPDSLQSPQRPAREYLMAHAVETLVGGRFQ